MTTFKQALKKEQDQEAQRLLNGFYTSLRKQGKIKNYSKVEFDKENLLNKSLQFSGCDTLIEKEPNCYIYAEEKICSNSDSLFFEMRMWSYSQRKYVDGWAVSKYKKTDTLIYYIAGVGLFVLPFQEVRKWLLDNSNTLPKHLSNDTKANKNVRVHIDVIKDQFPNSFIPVEELELMAKLGL